MSNATSKTLLTDFSGTGTAFAIAHVALLLHTVRLILASAEPSWPSYWMIFLAFDFPVSLGVMPVTWLLPPTPAGPMHDVTNFWWPLLYHGLVGSVWWYIVGAYLAVRIRRALNAKLADD